MYRNLFPLKVYVGGPPASGKTYYSKQLAAAYGIPHLMIGDMIKHAQNQGDDLSEKIRVTIEELKDIEVAAYEKTRKKKDPDLDRAKINVRLPDDLLHQIVRRHLGSPACMNKGFVLDGYPRNAKDAAAVFTDLIPKDDEEPNAPELPAEVKVCDKIIPQFCIVFDPENDFLKQRVQKLPKEETEGTHFTEQHLDRRLKVYREHNVNAQSEKHISRFFSEHIGE